METTEIEETKKNDLIIDVEENPKRKRDWFLFSIQHILAMLVACITVPLITGLPIGATLVAAGIGTLIYVFVTRKKSPVFLSSSFAYIAPMLSALALGVLTNGDGEHIPNYLAVMVGMVMVGVIYVIIALIIKKTGTGWINKLLPPVVVGPVIMVIGLALAGSAVGNVMEGTKLIEVMVKKDCIPVPWFYTCFSILVALVACFVTAISAHYGKKTISLIPFVIGMVGAYLFACVLTLVGHLGNLDYLKIIDFSPLNQNYGKIGAWINCDWIFTRAVDAKQTFDWGTLGSVALLFIPVALVTICEHIGDHKNLGNIIGRDLLEGEPGLTRTLIGDGIATAVSGCLCGSANTTYGENVAVIGFSKIASINVIILAAFMTIGFGLFAPLTNLLSTVPKCVTGGVSLLLYGFIASSGVKMLIKEKVDLNKTKNIMVASVILVAGIGGLLLGFGGDSSNYVLQITPTAVAMILGIILNLILKEKPKTE